MHDLFPDGQHKTVPSISMQSEMKCLYQSIAKLYEQGVDIDWSNLPTLGSQVTAVPRYSFDKKYLKEKTEQELVLCTGCNPHRKHHLYVYPTEEPTESFRVLLSPLTIPSVYQHFVMENIVVPGALYAECGFAIARYVYTHARVSLSVEFQQLITLKKDEIVGMEILPEYSSSEASEKHFIVRIKETMLACIQMKETETKPRELFNLNAVRLKCTEEVNKTNIYKSLKTFGFEYGAAFSLLNHAYRNSSECLATLELDDTVISEVSDTIIHPCIIDCMLQSTVLVLGSSNIATKEMLPKSVDGLIVMGSMESSMHVHTTLKFMGSNFFLFEIQLLSTDGYVIAEVSEFKIQALTSQKGKALPDMLGVKWNKIKDIPHDDHTKESEEQKRNVLLISNKDHHDDGEGYVSHVMYDSNDATQNLRKELKTLLMAQTIEAMVLIVPKEDAAEDAADAQSKVINLCLLLQSIFITLNDQSLHTPIFMCTFNAWPSPPGNKARDVNPTATALWGLLRTVIDEHVYTDIVGVELHTAPGDLNSRSLQRLLDILMADEDLADYPEVLITEQSIYVNQVVRLDGTSLSLDKRRESLPIRMEEVSGNVVVLSKNASKVTELYAFIQESFSSSKDQILLKAHTFALPPEKLFSTKMTSAHLFPDKMGESTDYVVVALEVTGHIKDGSNQEVTTCGPLTVGPELPISLDTTLTTASLPYYQAGDLCKLVLFWSLVEKVPTTRFSILASNDTKHLAELVKLLSCNATKRKDSDVNIILIDNIRDEVNYHETVVSLILLDVYTMSVMAGSWKNTYNLVSLTYLVTKDLQVYMACTLPDTQLCLLDTQLLFQLQQLKSIIPNIKEWMRKNTGLMTSICQRLHFANKAEYGKGIHGLLQFHSLDFSNLSVQLVSDKFFQKDGAYLVVGGLTGLGWLCVEFLAQNSAGYIAIVNRRAPTPEQMANMQKLGHHYGCKIKSFQGDVSSLKSLEEIMKLLTDEWSKEGSLRGIFTGAAVVQDGFFPVMERPAFENVLTPKIKGSWNLHQLTKDLPLDYFVMHSSVASILGNLGQANYSTGNAFLDGLAFHRHYLGLAAQTINWGPLDTGLLDNQDAIKEKLDSMGFHLTSKQEIMEDMSKLMLLNWTQSIPVILNQEAYANRIRNTGLQSFMKRFQHLLAGKGDGNEKRPTEDAQKIRFLSPPQRLEAYESFVQELISRILSVDIGRVGRDVSLFDLGLDSVTGMMMISLIERNTSFKLSAVSVLSDVTVASLAQLLNDFASEASE